MADDRLTNPAVEAYLAELRRSLGRSRDVERIVEEVHEHLHDAIDRLMALGRDGSTAATEAVRAFGSTTQLAEDLAQVGPLPTTFSRRSGLFGMLGAVAIAAVPLEAASREPAADGRDPMLVAPVIGIVLAAIGLLGIVARTRGAFGRARAVIATLLILLPIVAVGFGIGWGLVGVVMAVMILSGLGLVLHAVFRVGALPRPATIFLVVAGLGLAALSPTDVEKESAPYYLGFAALALGWIWLQYTLWSERPEQRA